MNKYKMTWVAEPHVSRGQISSLGYLPSFVAEKGIWCGEQSDKCQRYVDADVTELTDSDSYSFLIHDLLPKNVCPKMRKHVSVLRNY